MEDVLHVFGAHDTDLLPVRAAMNVLVEALESAPSRVVTHDSGKVGWLLFHLTTLAFTHVAG